MARGSQTESVMNTHLKDFSNDDLLSALVTHVRTGHVWQAALIAYLVEIESRRLHLELAHPSMWDFCVRGLGMSEGVTQRRLAAARLVQRFPAILGYLERGDIHLCALYLLRQRLTIENHEELLREASHKTSRAVEEMLARRFPRPDVPGRIEHVHPCEPVPKERRPKVEALSATRYRVELTISAETKEKLDRVADSMRHQNPAGDLEPIFDAALDLLLAKVERERLGKVTRPGKKSEERKPGTTPRKPATGRYIPQDVRRQVYQRDGVQCAFVDADGNRCPSRSFLELHHIEPKARGGSEEAANIQPLCHGHHQLETEKTFGREHVAKKIASRKDGSSE